jgi:AmmeMemoRadiSam system protein A
MDDYVKLAKKSLETYLRTGKALKLKDDDGLPEELRNRRAGAFVSLHENGELRGCIGTIGPTKINLAEEIIYNAISAGIHDPRFPDVEEEELEKLEYSVDVLGETEQVKSEAELDPERYGVIVTSGYRRGLLLPRLEGVRTVQEQIRICRLKGGIGPDEPVSLERFEVVRHF